MAISAASTFLIAKAPALYRQSSSLSSSNSVFFSDGRRDFSKRKSGCLVLSRSRSPTEGFNCRCLFGLGVPELAVIAGVAVLVFGPKQLPEVGRNFGKAIKGFQQAAKEFETELKKTPEESVESPKEEPMAISESEKEELELSGTKDGF